MLGQEVDGYTRQHNYTSQDYSMQNNTNYNRGGGSGGGGDLSSRSFSQHDRGDSGRSDGGRGESSSRFRSRTPGPDFMRARERDDEQYFGQSQQQRGRDTARSKTPTSELFKKQTSVGGTPDFIPASRYQSPPRSSQQHGGVNNRLHSSADYTDSRIPTSQQSYAANSTQYGDGSRPVLRKQSTSFEYVDPRPSNLTRIPYVDTTPGAVDALNRSHTSPDDDRYVEMTVVLQRQESGFGFRIIGGTEEGSQVRHCSRLVAACMRMAGHQQSVPPHTSCTSRAGC